MQALLASTFIGCGNVMGQKYLYKCLLQLDFPCIRLPYSKFVNIFNIYCKWQNVDKTHVLCSGVLSVPVKHDVFIMTGF